jgi:hypothetical protein
MIARSAQHVSKLLQASSFFVTVDASRRAVIFDRTDDTDA